MLRSGVDCDDCGICSSRNHPREGFLYREGGPSTNGEKRANTLHSRPTHQAHHKKCRHPRSVSVSGLVVYSEPSYVFAALGIEVEFKGTALLTVQCELGLWNRAL